MANADSFVLYVHTKGMRNNGGGGAEGAFNWTAYKAMPAHSWREYMSYFLIDHYDVCIEAIREKGYLTCGVLKQVPVIIPMHIYHLFSSIVICKL